MNKYQEMYINNVKYEFQHVSEFNMLGKLKTNRVKVWFPDREICGVKVRKRPICYTLANENDITHNKLDISTLAMNLKNWEEKGYRVEQLENRENKSQK